MTINTSIAIVSFVVLNIFGVVDDSGQREIHDYHNHVITLVIIFSFFFSLLLSYNIFIKIYKIQQIIVVNRFASPNSNHSGCLMFV